MKSVITTNSLIPSSNSMPSFPSWETYRINSWSFPMAERLLTKLKTLKKSTRMDLLPMHSQTFNEWLLPILAQPFLDSKKKLRKRNTFKTLKNTFHDLICFMTHLLHMTWWLMAYDIIWNTCRKRCRPFSWKSKDWKMSWEKLLIW